MMVTAGLVGPPTLFLLQLNLAGIDARPDGRPQENAPAQRGVNVGDQDPDKQNPDGRENRHTCFHDVLSFPLFEFVSQ